MKIAQPKLMFSALILGLALTLTSTSVKASFSQAPPAGANTGAEFLISWDGTTFSVAGPSGEGPYDGIEDTLFGVQNNSTAPLLSLFLSSTSSIGIFGFDGDGVSTFTGFPSGVTGYEGSISTTSMFDSTGPLDSFSITDLNHGTVMFGAGIPAGGSAYFALEDHIFNPGPCLDCCLTCPVPDTGSTLSLMAIACAAGLGLKRRFCRA